MELDDTRKLELLFHEAKNQPPEKLSQFLNNACANEPSLKIEIESLIKADELHLRLAPEPILSLIAKISATEEYNYLDDQASEDLPFDRIGEYKLIHHIKSGGMGEVYFAKHVSNKNNVALKILRSDRRCNPEIHKRFTRETNALAGINHPNIVTVYDSGDDKGVHYFAMELLRGLTLDEVFSLSIAKRIKISQHILLNWIHEIAEALVCVHKNELIHRDVKPSNIYITPGNKAVLMDFGIARHLDLSTLTQTGDFRGTPHFAAPEQILAKGHIIDARTDIYSLGATLYEAVTGCVPFEGETTEQIFHQILKVKPIPPVRLNSGISLKLNTIILKAMEKDPAYRYQAMNEFSDDLLRFLNTEEILAKPIGIKIRIRKRLRQNPLFSIALIIALISVLTLTIFLPRYISQITYEKNTAQAQYDELLQLSDSKLLSQLENEADELWPAYADKAPEMKAWITQAEPLLQRLNQHKATLNEWRANARQSGNVSSGEGPWVFDKTEDQWKHDILAELVTGLSAFSDEKSGTVKSVQDRFEFAQTIYQESVEKHQKEWDNAIDAISDKRVCPMYDGLLITPQVGLVPIGPDPNSGLWEFGNFQTGQVPKRAEDGEILLKENSGLVLILIPGGTFNMDAMPPTEGKPLRTPNVDFEASGTEGPVHTVTVNPFLISKYEMTQGQWLRFTGDNPSRHGPQKTYGGKKHPLLHPVETVSWNDCNRILSRLALRLPSEAEWEYSARAMTSTIWWTGDKRESLAGALNIADLFCMNNGGEKDWKYETWLDDGYVTHAPVNLFKPNAFGLHNTCGNVWEWCQDSACETNDSAPTGGSSLHDKTVSYRILRGGGWNMIADYCRSADHKWSEPVDRSNILGVRPARSIQ